MRYQRPHRSRKRWAKSCLDVGAEKKKETTIRSGHPNISKREKHTTEENHASNDARRDAQSRRDDGVAETLVPLDGHKCRYLSQHVAISQNRNSEGFVFVVCVSVPIDCAKSHAESINKGSLQIQQRSRHFKPDAQRSK